MDSPSHNWIEPIWSCWDSSSVKPSSLDWVLRCMSQVKLSRVEIWNVQNIVIKIELTTVAICLWMRMYYIQSPYVFIHPACPLPSFAFKHARIPVVTAPQSLCNSSSKFCWKWAVTANQPQLLHCINLPSSEYVLFQYPVHLKVIDLKPSSLINGPFRCR